MPNESRPYPEEALLVGAARSVWDGSDARINISIGVGEKLAAAMAEHLPDTLEGVFITDSDIRHIKRKHGGDEKSRGQLAVAPDDFARIPAVLNDFARIPAVLNDFETCEHTDTDKLGNRKFVLTKSMGETIFLVTIQRGKRKLEIKTMWKKGLSGASC